MSTISAQARLVLAIGAPGFAERLLDVAGACLAHDAAALLIFHPAAPPTVLVDRLRPAERAWLYGDYLSGVYALSPFFRAAQKLKAPRVARVREIAPKGFAQSEYHRRYFALIGVDDMIGLLIPASDAETVFMSFSRSTGSRRFTPSDAKALAASAELLAAAVTRHCQIAGPLASRHTPAATAPLTVALNNFRAMSLPIFDSKKSTEVFSMSTPLSILPCSIPLTRTRAPASLE